MNRRRLALLVVVGFVLVLALPPAIAAGCGRQARGAEATAGPGCGGCGGCGGGCARVAEGEPQGRGPGMGKGQGQGHRHGQGAGRGPAAAGAEAGYGPPDRETIHALFADHKKIARTVTDIPGGVSADTTSDDPKVAAMIKSHVHEMKARLEAGRPVRMWDPLFAAIVEHADKIEMQVEELEKGVRVVETSKDPQVQALIRQHARRGVSEFVDQGPPRMHQPTPLPEGWSAR